MPRLKDEGSEREKVITYGGNKTRRGASSDDLPPTPLTTETPLIISLFFCNFRDCLFSMLPHVTRNSDRSNLRSLQPRDALVSASPLPCGIIMLHPPAVATLPLSRSTFLCAVRATLSQLLSAQRRLPESRLVPLVTTGRSSWST